MGKSITELIDALPTERKARVEASAQRMADEMIAESESLNVLRKALGQTQTQVAQALGIKQNAVSQLESRTEIYVSTLKKYVKALGMELEFTLKTKAGVRIALANFHPWDEAEPALIPAKKHRLAKTASTPKSRARTTAKSTKSKTAQRVPA